jgi:hypothetical protein
MPDPTERQTSRGQEAEFHKRAGKSHEAARKLLTGMAVGSFGVLYATLTGKDAPMLDAGNNKLALLSIVTMAVSAGCGLFAWRADAAWAYQVAKCFEKTPALERPPRDISWHKVKKLLEFAQLTLFLLGLALATALTLRLLK